MWPTVATLFLDFLIFLLFPLNTWSGSHPPSFHLWKVFSSPLGSSANHLSPLSLPLTRSPPFSSSFLLPPPQCPTFTPFSFHSLHYSPSPCHPLADIRHAMDSQWGGKRRKLEVGCWVREHKGGDFGGGGGLAESKTKRLLSIWLIIPLKLSVW